MPEASKWEETVIDINAWLDRNGIDRAYKKDMKPTYEHIKGDLEAQAEITWHARDKEVEEARKLGRKDERKTIGTFLEESMETFYAIYRDSAGEQTYTIARHALDKIIKTLKAGQSFNPKEWEILPSEESLLSKKE